MVNILFMVTVPIHDAFSTSSTKAALDETSTELLHELSVVREKLIRGTIILSKYISSILCARVVVMVKFLLKGSTHITLTYLKVSYTLRSHSLWKPKPCEKIRPVSCEQNIIAPQKVASNKIISLEELHTNLCIHSYTTKFRKETPLNIHKTGFC